MLDDVYARLGDGCRAASTTPALGPPVGAAEGPCAERTRTADLVLHIHREVIHHLAEIALLRDLYRVSH